MNSRIVAKTYLSALQTLAEGGKIRGHVYTVPPRVSEIGVLKAAGFACNAGHITEKGLAALDQIRKAHPDASPYAFYRDAPDDWQ